MTIFWMLCPRGLPFVRVSILARGAHLPHPSLKIYNQSTYQLYLSNLLITAHNSRNNCSNNDTHDFVYFDGHHRHHHHNNNNKKNPVNLLLLFFKTIIPMIIFPTTNSKTNVFHTFSYKQFAQQAAANTVKRPCRQCRHRSHLASLTWPELSHQVAFKPQKKKNTKSHCKVKDVIYTHDMFWQ